MGKEINKIVLAYSGGLDTSIILKWLINNYKAEVIAYLADLGQEEDLVAAKTKALNLGASCVEIIDLKREFVKDYVFPMFRANCVYEGWYLLGTSIARPLISKGQIDVAKKHGAEAVSHGATGKGNDQLRFEYSYIALNPKIEIISPWRIWNFEGREDLIQYAKENDIEIPKDKLGEAPFSIDANLLHISAEGKELEDPAIEPKEHIYQITNSIDKTPDQAEDIEIAFKKGDPISVNQEEMPPEEILAKLNKLGSKHGIGRIDMLETRTFGTKSRGTYETPGGTILLQAHRAIEQLTLDGDSIMLKDQLMPKYAKLIYNGFWFTRERVMLQALIDKSQDNVCGNVRLRLHKGNVMVIGRESTLSLYAKTSVSFERDDEGDNQSSNNRETFSAQDAEGYIKINSIRLSKNDKL